MRRDWKFMLALLRRIESGHTHFQPIALEEAQNILSFTPDEPLTREEAQRLEFHLKLLEEEGLIRAEKMGGASWYTALTAAGHRVLAEADPGVMGH